MLLPRCFTPPPRYAARHDAAADATPLRHFD